jgi:hypothetical protein
LADLGGFDEVTIRTPMPASLSLTQRLAAQQLDSPVFAAADEVVAWLGAVQAQDYAGAKWAVGIRLAQVEGGPAVTEATIEGLLARGAILRVHAFRFTWQLIAPADVRWMLALVAPRLKVRATRRDAELGLDARTVRRSRTVLERELRDGKQLTREELSGVLERAGVATAGPRLSHLLAHAEIDAVICSGSRRGKQTTHALLDLRVPGAQAPLARDAALAELAFRYVRSRGPATVADFIWWSGLAPSDARAGFESLRSKVVSEVREGQTYVRSTERPASPARGVTGSPRAWLLPAFDEYLVAYRVRDAPLDPAHVKRFERRGGMLDPVVVVDGRVVGRWRRTLTRDAVAIAIEMFEPAAAREARRRRAITAAALRYAAFLGLEARVTIERARSA